MRLTPLSQRILRLCTLFFLAPLAVHARPAQQVRVNGAQQMAELQAEKQRKEGTKYFADGNVEIRYKNMRLRADHLEGDDATNEVIVRGHVQFDYDTQHLEAEDATFNLRTGHGVFHQVRGRVAIQRRPNPLLLVTQNPLSFEAEEVERIGERDFKIRHAWMTVCTPEKPIWRFYAPNATLEVGQKIAFLNANFRLFGIPLLYLPYATAPANSKVRQSGFLIPEIANTSRKGFVIGDAYYWAPKEWMDLTAGAYYLSRRGWSQTANFRATPWENVRLGASYFGVVDRGLPTGPGGARVPQGGHESSVDFDATLLNGWRAVADIHTLTSLTFRLAFSDTFGEAVNAEVRRVAFVTNHFHGITVGFGVNDTKNFLSLPVGTSPETSVILRSAPGARISSFEQSPWKKIPVYFAFEVFADAAHRSETCTVLRPTCVDTGGALLANQRFETPGMVQRNEIAPRVTIPLRWGPWIGVTPTFTLRTTHYGSQFLAGTVVNDSVRRTTGELTVDLRPPAFTRVWDHGDSKWKHTIEPQILYRYVTGVNDFGRFLRFDESDTLTDTNEVELGVTQRLYHRVARPGGDTQEPSDSVEEVLTWRIAQKRYFDPTFGGALVPGQRNVFQALDSITSFAFADTKRHYSPIVSDLRITPGGKYDAEIRLDYDPLRGRLTAAETLMRMRPYREFNITLAHFRINSDPTLSPRSNQVRALIGYGDINRRGLNAAFGFSYDISQRFLQSHLMQVSYNGSCCGIAFEYRRLALGPVRTENQFRVALILANIGTFGNLRRQEKIF